MPLVAAPGEIRRYSLDGKDFYPKWARSQTDQRAPLYAMGLFKADFYRFFALGFAGGALLVFGAMDLEQKHPLSDSIVPPAQAAPAR